MLAQSRQADQFLLPQPIRASAPSHAASELKAQLTVVAKCGRKLLLGACASNDHVRPGAPSERGTTLRTRCAADLLPRRTCAHLYLGTDHILLSVVWRRLGCEWYCGVLSSLSLFADKGCCVGGYPQFSTVIMRTAAPHTYKYNVAHSS